MSLPLYSIVEASVLSAELGLAAGREVVIGYVVVLYAPQDCGYASGQLWVAAEDEGFEFPEFREFGGYVTGELVILHAEENEVCEIAE